MCVGGLKLDLGDVGDLRTELRGRVQEDVSSSAPERGKCLYSGFQYILIASPSSSL